MLLLTLRGTPFLYQGEELGLLDAEIPPERVVDPGGRDGCRAPMPWDSSPGHGWTSPWLPMPPEVETRNVEVEGADPGSMLELYRALLALRAATPALRDGSLSLIDAPDGVLAYRRTVDGDAGVTVLVSMADEGRDVAGVSGTILIDSLGSSRPGSSVVSGAAGPAHLAPRQALVVGT